MASILLSAVGSILAIVFVYGVYWASQRRCSREKAFAECWWLPRWNCFRFVVRNMHGDENLTAIRYRAWIRVLRPAGQGSSVNTFDDRDVASGERLLLRPGQDLPVLCFRFEEAMGQLNLVVTDKLGNPRCAHSVNPELESLQVEYALRLRNWFLFKHEISRAFTIHQRLSIKGVDRNLFRDYLLPMQGGPERRVDLVFQTAEEVTVTV